MADVQTDDDVLDFLYANRALLVNSSNVRWVAYGYEKETIIVHFLNDAEWEYGRFDVGRAHEFATAGSKGGWIWSNILVRGKGNRGKYQPGVFAVQRARGQ